MVIKKVSVCMATYNGGSYIKEQLDSILIQLSGNDELIIVDDASTDNTLQILHGYHAQDSRIKIYANKSNVGHVKSFEIALKKSEGDYIVLSDQDDLWVPNRLKIIVNELELGACFVATEFEDFSESGKVIRRTLLPRSIKPLNILRIFFGKISYFGCSMAFSRRLLVLLLPFPRFVEMHDIWLAMAANLSSDKVVHLNKVSILHRIHSANKTPKFRRTWGQVLSARVNLIKASFILVLRLVKST